MEELRKALIASQLIIKLLLVLRERAGVVVLFTPHASSEMSRSNLFASVTVQFGIREERSWNCCEYALIHAYKRKSF